MRAVAHEYCIVSPLLYHRMWAEGAVPATVAPMQAGEVEECARSLTTGVSDVLNDVGSASVNVFKGNAKLSGRIQMKVKIWAVLPVDLRFRYLFPSA